MGLFAHCDSEVSDLMRDKGANLFNPSFSSTVKAGEGSADLLGGEATVRSRLTGTTKEDELLTKNMPKPFKGQKKARRKVTIQWLPKVQDHKTLNCVRRRRAKSKIL